MELLLLTADPVPSSVVPTLSRLPHRVRTAAYKEFELLKYLAQHAGQVLTRAQLLPAAWGYDFFGGPRTVDVHI
ncbi:MAG: hypothetical protein QOH17_656, partial [Pseudonocardiales bacterium]|nr:hypothetical protein [Pseudonocardiales bacterium]